MKEMIYKQDAINAILGEYPDAHYPSWYADIIKGIPQNYLEILDDGTLSITLDEADFYNIKRVVLMDKSGIWCKTMYQDGYDFS